jgi:hypothetical protein
MIREMLSWLRNEERFREEILGVAPAEPGLRPDGLSRCASQAKPLVPNAERDVFWPSLQTLVVVCWWIVWCVEVGARDNLGWVTIPFNVLFLATIVRRLWAPRPVSIPLRGRIA